MRCADSESLRRPGPGAEGLNKGMRLLAAAGLVFALGACSSVPNWANPVEWYDSTAAWISGDDDNTREARAESREQARQSPQASEPYPNLATVPDRPEATSPSQRREVEGALMADREQARHEALDRPRTVSPPPAEAPPQPRLTPPSGPAPEVEAQQAAPRSEPRPEPRQADQRAPVREQPRAQQARAETPAAPVPGRAAAQGSVEDVFLSAIAQQQQTSIDPDHYRHVLPEAPSGTGRSPEAGEQMASRGERAASPTTSGGLVVSRAVSGDPLGVIYFADGSFELSRDAIQLITDIGQQYRTTQHRISVVGHASSRTREMGPEEHRLVNLRVSMARAEAVAQRLIRAGISAERITVQGLADSAPIYQEFMPSGEAGNRRAEIYLH